MKSLKYLIYQETLEYYNPFELWHGFGFSEKSSTAISYLYTPITAIPFEDTSQKKNVSRFQNIEAAN